MIWSILGDLSSRYFSACLCHGCWQGAATNRVQGDEVFATIMMSMMVIKGCTQIPISTLSHIWVFVRLYGIVYVIIVIIIIIIMIIWNGQWSSNEGGQRTYGLISRDLDGWTFQSWDMVLLWTEDRHDKQQPGSLQWHPQQVDKMFRNLFLPLLVADHHPHDHLFNHILDVEVLRARLFCCDPGV